jgi:hypothetical protein
MYVINKFLSKKKNVKMIAVYTLNLMYLNCICQKNVI